jgi:hypothetical protein
VPQNLDAQKLMQQAQLIAQQQKQQQQQKAAAAQSAAKSGSDGPAAKRQKASEQLPPAPDDAVPLYEVLYKASKAGVNLQASAAAAGAAAGAAGAVSAAEGPSTSIEDILRRAEYAGRAVPDAVAARGRGGSDDEQLIPDAALKRLMELQGLNKVGGCCCCRVVAFIAADSRVLLVSVAIDLSGACCTEERLQHM